LGTNSVTSSWKIRGQLGYVEGSNPNGYNVAQFLEVQDASGKTLAKFHVDIDPINSNSSRIFANNQILAQGDVGTIRAKTQRLQDFEIAVVNGVVTYRYADFPAFVTTLTDSTANWKTPAKLRLVFQARGLTGPVRTTKIDLKDFRLHVDY